MKQQVEEIRKHTTRVENTVNIGRLKKTKLEDNCKRMLITVKIKHKIEELDEKENKRGIMCMQSRPAKLGWDGNVPD